MEAPANTRLPTATLRLLTLGALVALIVGNLDRASAIMGLDLPPFFLGEAWLWRIRHGGIRANPDAAPWLVRALVGRPAEAVVGHAGFHGPPDNAGMVEVGYTILPEYRRQGYGRATVEALLRYAAGSPEVRTVRASISPDNVASLARSLGFRLGGEQWDDVDGLARVFERPLTI